ncbi:GAF domain-containing protein [Roseiterribacter gracilis]|uniref:Histidine kinase n=1 Tax=Roseiterribacter gracilis TaxID=2812848 RepID=A0A8S8XD19_9PROT|nr:histidine kinase [Rhodospirillales bacterium TMPK1]
MHELRTVSADKQTAYDDIAQQLEGLFTGERDWLANAANMSSLLFHSLPDLNWAGFYLMKDGELVLGPFQGKPACIRIAMGRGVCGTAAARKESVLVEDVDSFPGHIACDAASQSELVVPLVRDGQVLGVLDLDSPRKGRFDAVDRAGCERLVATFLAGSDF